MSMLLGAVIECWHRISVLLLMIMVRESLFHFWPSHGNNEYWISLIIMTQFFALFIFFISNLLVIAAPNPLIVFYSTPLFKLLQVSGTMVACTDGSGCLPTDKFIVLFTVISHTHSSALLCYHWLPQPVLLCVVLKMISTLCCANLILFPFLFLATPTWMSCCLSATVVTHSWVLLNHFSWLPSPHGQQMRRVGLGRRDASMKCFNNDVWCVCEGWCRVVAPTPLLRLREKYGWVLLFGYELKVNVIIISLLLHFHVICAMLNKLSQRLCSPR